MKCRVFLLFAAILLGPLHLGADQKSEDQAAARADAWLLLLDQGKYDETWDEAARLFKASVSKDQWKESAARARSPLGKLLSRTIKSKKYAETLPGAPDGKYVVIQYDATFENKKSALETVTPMMDPDGVWRVSGYFVK